ncbi:protein-glutamate O-methyltransferase CheR [Pelagicoccus sp. SDUM812003]|uniref:CheR family methyltransferase n=1 Tax=Pelagicoccus sp. SDUM812003 TaxID=3041267 RepID=UPI00280D5E94|nr:protein-glutamate O-methyltransferase CheR [Pelagicoccus sp. SDUM812003]MDQ8203333.1 protein-glutamate O-methyltransferase CheR [Pelagicoccus sp. SDUM812003]
MSITKQEFDFFRDWARERSAISLEEDKEYLVKSRLEPILRRHKIDTISELLASLSRRTVAAGLEDEVIDAMTTNETFFFRDIHPFQVMRDHLIPQLERELGEERKLNVWSAACSTGQEIYSLIMLMKEHFPQLFDWDLKLYATDISSTVLEKARSGIYTDMEAKRGLDERLRNRYFTRLPNDRWQIHESLRKLVTFRQLNFIDSWPDMGRHHFVLIRNVLIYFDVDVKRQILERVRRRLDRRGFMMLGSSETTLNIDPGWEVRRDGRAAYYVPRATAGVSGETRPA